MNDELRSSIRDNDIEKVKEFMDKGVDVEAKDRFFGATPLMQAAFEGRIEIALLLIQKGADVNAKNKLGATPLMYAVSAGQIETARMLIEKGADVNARDNGDETALSKAEKQGRSAAVELLRQYGAR